MEGAKVLELPWPVSCNQLWRVHHGRLVLSEKARHYRQLVTFKAIYLRRAFWEGKLFVHIEAYPPNKRKSDLDNLIKNLLDSLEEARVFQDDNQIDRLLIERKEIEKPGKVIVSILKIT